MLIPATRFRDGLRTFVVDQKCVPWTISNAFEMWLEHHAQKQWPALYRLIHCGRRRDIVRPLTSGPKHHFYGYYDKSPWNDSETLVLAHEVSFNDRPPGPADHASVGIIHVDEGNEFEPISETSAWNWQQGAMLQWHPSADDGGIVYNDRRKGKFVGIYRLLGDGQERVYELPFYALTPTGKHALSLNFSRLHEKRPGYGYAGVADPFADDPHPKRDGIFCINMEKGASEQILSLHALAHRAPTPEMRYASHWVNHIQVSPDGDRFGFLHRWSSSSDGMRTRLYTANLDGSNLKCCLDGGMVSHYDWLDNAHLLAWARTAEFGIGFVVCDVRSGPLRPFAAGAVKEDGHCSFSPDGKWILNDTYPDRFQMRSLMLIRYQDEKRVNLCRLFAPPELAGEIRCDLHPRWSRSGHQVCIDSAHTGERQMYVVNLQGIV